MRRPVGIGVVAVLLLSLATPLNAATPKVGSTCSKSGITKMASGKKFTCIKSGKRLIWARGPAVAKPKVAPSVDLSKSASITPSSELSSLEICKTVDLTLRGTGSNGFPRPANLANGKSEIKILALPIIFEEIPFTETDLKNLQDALKQTTEFYARTSFNRIKITFDIPAKNLWVKLNTSAKDYGILPNKPQQNNEVIVKDALMLADQEIDFNKYDSVIIESGFTSSTSVGQGFSGQSFTTKTGNINGATLQIGQAAGKANIIAHELGHSLYGLEDLYVFLNSQRPTVPEPLPAGRWDLMSDAGLQSDFFGWNKLLMGWMKDEEVRCVQNQSSSTHYLADHTNSVGTKLLLINLKPGITIAIESRPQSSKSQALLVYKIDSNIHHGEGPITAEKFLMSKGEIKNMDNWSIEVKESAPTGLIVSLIKSS